MTSIYGCIYIYPEYQNESISTQSQEFYLKHFAILGDFQDGFGQYFRTAQYTHSIHGQYLIPRFVCFHVNHTSLYTCPHLFSPVVFMLPVGDPRHHFLSGWFGPVNIYMIVETVAMIHGRWCNSSIQSVCLCTQSLQKNFFLSSQISQN